MAASKTGLVLGETVVIDGFDPAERFAVVDLQPQDAAPGEVLVARKLASGHGLGFTVAASLVVALAD